MAAGSGSRKQDQALILLLPVPDEVVQDTAEPDAAKLNTLSHPTGPRTTQAEPTKPTGSMPVFLPIQDHEQVQDTTRSRCIFTGAIMGTSADSKKYLVGSLILHVYQYLSKFSFTADPTPRNSGTISRCWIKMLRIMARIMIVVLSPRAASLTWQWSEERPKGGRRAAARGGSRCLG